jgi:putative beta-1,4-xylosyltransferase IRX9
MWRDEREVVVRGPACSSSAVTGWFSQDLSDGTAAAASTTSTARARPSGEVDVHGFAFNSSVLWDPERWGRYPTSEPDKSQVSVSRSADHSPFTHLLLSTRHACDVPPPEYTAVRN